VPLIYPDNRIGGKVAVNLRTFYIEIVKNTLIDRVMHTEITIDFIKIHLKSFSVVNTFSHEIALKKKIYIYI